MHEAAAGEAVAAGGCREAGAAAATLGHSRPVGGDQTLPSISKLPPMTIRAPHSSVEAAVTKAAVTKVVATKVAVTRLVVLTIVIKATSSRATSRVTIKTGEVVVAAAVEVGEAGEVAASEVVAEKGNIIAPAHYVIMLSKLSVVC